MSEDYWSDEVPTEPGMYWFTGWTSKFGLREFEQDTVLVEVRKGANSVFYVANGSFVYPYEMYGKWKWAFQPVAPKLSKEDFK